MNISCTRPDLPFLVYLILSREVGRIACWVAKGGVCHVARCHILPCNIKVNKIFTIRLCVCRFFHVLPINMDQGKQKYFFRWVQNFPETVAIFCILVCNWHCKSFANVAIPNIDTSRSLFPGPEVDTEEFNSLFHHRWSYRRHHSNYYSKYSLQYWSPEVVHSYQSTRTNTGQGPSISACKKHMMTFDIHIHSLYGDPGMYAASAKEVGSHRQASLLSSLHVKRCPHNKVLWRAMYVSIKWSIKEK